MPINVGLVIYSFNRHSSSEHYLTGTVLGTKSIQYNVKKKGICVSINRWTDTEDVKCVCMSAYINLMEYYCHKKEWNIAICNNMGRPRMYHTEWSKSKTNIIWYDLYVESKNNTNEIIYKTQTDSQTWKTNLWIPKGKQGERNKLGIWD